MRILIVDDFHPSIFSMLEEKGWTYSYEPEITRPEMISRLPDYEGLLIRSKTRVDQELITGAKKLCVVGRAGSGIENIDHEYLSERGIQVVNAPEGNRDAVGDHTLGLLLGLTKNIWRSSFEVKQDAQWKREANRGRELNSLTVGIVGYGNTGSAVVERLAGFRCRILIYDKYYHGPSPKVATLVSLPELKSSSDVISFHVPLTEETHHYLSEDFLEDCRDGIILLNTSRGEIFDTKALMKGLISGKVEAAALDVIENEKINNLNSEELKTFDFLRKSPQVILTPHIAGWTKESHIRINEVLVRKISDLFPSK